MSPSCDDLAAPAAHILSACRAKALRLATAESCTGGLIAAALTEPAGASDVFDCGFVTYSDAAKVELLGVRPETIARHGAVSREVAEAMALGALHHSRADIVVAVTGIAGPGGGTDDKPVGLVHIAAMRRGGDLLHREIRTGDIGRGAIRRETVVQAFALIGALV